MAKIEMPENKLVELIDAAHEAKAEKPRGHMGCSILGHACDRWLWLSFRWAVQPKFEGRILRLFRRGHNEEATIIADLRAAGVKLAATSGAQAKVDFGCHVSGSIDAIIESGVPEAPATRHIAEFKTHSKKSFDELVKNGVEKAKPMHFVQMQVYMAGTKIDRALYLAVCKDDDRIHTERVRFDNAIADRAIDRGHRLALANRMPDGISIKPDWYECRFCEGHSFCHVERKTEHANCRTCAHSTSQPDSTWRCERHGADNIPVEFQHTGCDGHVLHPDLVPWELVDSRGLNAVFEIDGKEVCNGAPAPGIFTSREILANAKACAHADDVINELRDTMGGRVEGG
jgi:hypothetical protein